MTETNPGATGMNVDPTTIIGSGGGVGRQVVVTTVAIVLGLLVGAILIVLSGLLGTEKTFDLGLPVTAYRALLDGSLLCEKGFQANGFACNGAFLDLKAIGNTLNAATPLILAGLSVAFGFRAGLFNIGGQGQFFLGAFMAAIIGTRLGGIPFPIAAVIALLAGALGGAFWGFIPGVLKAWRGAHEVVVTIMLNSTAALLLNYLASEPFKDPTASFPRTPDVAAGALLPKILETAHAGILIAIVVAIGVWFLLFKTTLGFEIRTVGANANAARYAGIRPGLITVLTMTIAGSLAGLAGSVEILGITKNYPAEYNTTFGFDGIAVALLGRSHPFGVIGAALLFAVLRAGAGTLQRQTEIPSDIIGIVQGVILLFVAADVVIRRLIPEWRTRRRAAPAAAAA